jgi:hypothetical protein
MGLRWIAAKFTGQSGVHSESRKPNHRFMKCFMSLLKTMTIGGAVLGELAGAWMMSIAAQVEETITLK